MKTIDEFVETLSRWSGDQDGIKAAAIVGSHARGTARADSDIDVVLICAEPAGFLEDSAWLEVFGRMRNAEREDWGLVQSWRVFYENGIELEVCVTTEQWCSAEEIPRGTGRVVGDGIRIVYDPSSILADLVVSVQAAQLGNQ